jgi:hypothetical protein
MRMKRLEWNDHENRMNEKEYLTLSSVISQRKIDLDAGL